MAIYKETYNEAKNTIIENWIEHKSKPLLFAKVKIRFGDKYMLDYTESHFRPGIELIDNFEGQLDGICSNFCKSSENQATPEISPLFKIIPFGSNWCIAFYVKNIIKGIAAVRSKKEVANSVLTSINILVSASAQIRVAMLYDNQDDDFPGVNFLLQDGDNARVADWLVVTGKDPFVAPPAKETDPKVLTHDVLNQTWPSETSYPASMEALRAINTSDQPKIDRPGKQPGVIAKADDTKQGSFRGETETPTRVPKGKWWTSIFTSLFGNSHLKDSPESVSASEGEAPDQNNKCRKKNDVQNEKKAWFLRTKRKKVKGPYALKELTDVLKAFTIEDGFQIRKGKSGSWFDWAAAFKTYPMLPKPRYRKKKGGAIRQYDDIRKGRGTEVRHRDNIEIENTDAIRIPDSEPRAKGKRPYGTTADWFRDASKRGVPRSPSDLHLKHIKKSRYSLQEWAQRISAHPRRIHCMARPINQLGSVTQVLFDAIKHDHGLSSVEVANSFDEYLGAACPRCFGGLTGRQLQRLPTCLRRNTVIRGSVLSPNTFGGSPGSLFKTPSAMLDAFTNPVAQRILEGHCATCESSTYYIIWHGEK